MLAEMSAAAHTQRRSSGRPLQTVSGGESSETRPADWLDSRGLGAQLVQLLKAFSAALPAQADAGAPQADRPGAEVRSTWKQLVQVRPCAACIGETGCGDRTTWATISSPPPPPPCLSTHVDGSAQAC